MLNNKKILVTNDDGYFALGILLLVKELYKYTKDIIIVSPKEQNSAVSQKLTLFNGLELNKENSIYEDIPTYSVNGTPTDCVKMALVILDYHPDYIFSGINQGVNLANDILYSGTVAACFEAGLNHIKAVAVSVDYDSFEASKYLSDAIEYISNNEYLLSRSILNINLPHNPKGIKITHQGENKYRTSYEVIDGKYYTRGHTPDNTRGQNQDDNADVIAHEQGYISITPLTIDRTDKGK